MAADRIELTISAKDVASSAFSSVQGKVIALNQSLGVLTASFGGMQNIITNTLGAYAKFETTLKRVQITSRASAKEIKQIEKVAFDLGKTTVFTSKQVADGFLILAKSGKTVTQQIELIKPALDLATAGGIDLVTATGS